jgi:RAB protein geranylgeranyltransferase component A
MEEILGAILGNVTKLEERADNEKQRINEKVEQIYNEIVEKTCNEKIEEKFESETRRKNLIIFNVKEQYQELSLRAKETKDREFCERL